MSYNNLSRSGGTFSGNDAWTNKDVLTDAFFTTLNSYILSASAGAFTLSGKSATLKRGYRLNTTATSSSNLTRTSWVLSSSHNNTSDLLNLTDGNVATNWQSHNEQFDRQWFQIDMSASHTIDQIVLDSTGSLGDYGRGYLVFLSSDGVSWGSPVASGSPSSAPVTINFTSQAARYIKIYQTVAASVWWTVTEVTAYAGGSSLSKSGWTATASYANSDAGNLVDGATSPRWTTSGNQNIGMWLKLDLGSTQSFDGLLLNSQSHTGDYGRGYDVYVSSDGVSWGASIASGTATATPVSVSFAQQSARYVLIYQTGTSGSWWTLDEVYLSITTHPGVGSFTLSGKTVAFARTREIAAYSGNFALSGKTAAFRKTSILSVSSGTYTLSGKTIGLLFGRRLNAQHGTLSLTGNTAAFIKYYKLLSTVGLFSITGQTLRILNNRKLSSSAGTFIFSGEGLLLKKGLILAVQRGSFNFSGNSINFLNYYRVRVSHGLFQIIGINSALLFNKKLILISGVYNLTGNTVLLSKPYSLHGDAGSYILTGNAARTLLYKILAASVGHYVFTGKNAALTPRGAYVINAQRTLKIIKDNRMVAVVRDDRTLIVKDQ